MEDWQILVILAIALAAVIFYNISLNKKNRKAALSGEDKERVRKAAEPLLNAIGTQNVLYSHWEKTETYGRTTKTTYYRYVVSYKDQTLYIAPLYIDKNTRQFQIAQPAVYTPEKLGKITVSAVRKNDAVSTLHIWLGNKEGETLFQFDVDAENLQKTRYYPVNLFQQEECADFERFLTSLAQSIDSQNPGVDDLIKAGDGNTIGGIGAGLSIFSLILAFAFPPVGAALALIGLIMALIGKKKGSKSKAPMIITIVCMLLCAGSLAVYLSTLR